MNAKFKSTEEAFMELENSMFEVASCRQRIIEAQNKIAQLHDEITVDLQLLDNAEERVHTLTDSVLVITDEDHYRRMIDHVTTLMMEPDPEPNTPEGRHLDALVSAIVDYEDRFYPVDDSAPDTETPQ